MAVVITSSDDAEQDVFQITSRMYVLKSAISTSRRDLEGKLQTDISNFLDDWYTLLADEALTSGFIDSAINAYKNLIEAKSIDKLNDALTYLISPMIVDLLENPNRQELETTLNTYGLISFKEGAKTALKAMGFENKFDLKDQNIINSIESRAVEMSRKILSDTFHDVRQSVKNNLLDGILDRYALSYAISHDLQMRLDRARRIARTETQAYFSTGLFEEYRRAGIKRIRWVRIGDKKTRQEHIENADQGWITLGDQFKSGQIHPGDGVGAINCRCTLEADLRIDDLKPWDGNENIDVLPSYSIIDEANEVTELDWRKMVSRSVQSNTLKPKISDAETEMVQTPALD